MHQDSEGNWTRNAGLWNADNTPKSNEQLKKK